MQRKTKIVATLGPASDSPDGIAALLEAGADVFRLNFSHGRAADKLRVARVIRDAASRLGREVGILADLQGPKIRTGLMEGGGVTLAAGSRLTITTRKTLGTAERFSTGYRRLPADVAPGAQILLDDGNIELSVVACRKDEVDCLVVTGGVLKDNKGINLPGSHVSAPSLTAKDLEDVGTAVACGADFIALSFVRSAADICHLQAQLCRLGSEALVIAKIEKPEAIGRLDEIVAAADGVMVARGDLGVEVPAEQVPVLQKRIIRACNLAGKPVITATQMLESMVKLPRATRAETSDVANAILDGTDAVMLSAETASGLYPVEAVRTMARIAAETEGSGLMTSAALDTDDSLAGWPAGCPVGLAVARSACRAATRVGARAIVAYTRTGGSATLVSRFRPPMPVIALSEDEGARNRLALHFAVERARVGACTGSDEQVAEMEKILLSRGFSPGDLVVITMGIPVGVAGTTNMMKIHRLGTAG